MAAALIRRTISLQSSLRHVSSLNVGCAPQPVRLAAFSAIAEAAAPGRVFGACVFERLPLVVPPHPDWEVEHSRWRFEWNLPYFKKYPADFIDEPRTEETDSAVAASNRWEPAPLESEADRSGDVRSLKRRLDQRVFMLVRRKGGSGAWEFPAVEHEEGETIRGSAERALGLTLVREGLQPFFVGNAPAGHVETGEGTTFFHRCQMIAGTVRLVPGGPYSDLRWAAKDELPEFVQDQALLDLFQKML
ncbi:MRPL46 [Auxenochlorella protothecoides x Auxenochlorella symbiontica]